MFWCFGAQQLSEIVRLRRTYLEDSCSPVSRLWPHAISARLRSTSVTRNTKHMLALWFQSQNVNKQRTHTQLVRNIDLDCLSLVYVSFSNLNIYTFTNIYNKYWTFELYTFGQDFNPILHSHEFTFTRGVTQLWIILLDRFLYSLLCQNQPELFN